MVTATTTRLPHPIQSGLKPATAWLGARLLGTAVLTSVLLCLPWVVPDVRTVNSTAFLVLLPIGVVAIGAQFALGRVVRFHTPGALAREGTDSWGVASPRWPGVVASVIGSVTIVVAAFVSAERGAADGSTALFLGAVGGGLSAFVITCAIRDWCTGKRRAIALNVVDAAMAIGLILAATTAPDPRGFAVNAATYTAVLVAMIAAFVFISWHVIRKDLPAHSEVPALSRLSDAATNWLDPTATLATHSRNRDTVLVLAVASGIGAGALFLIALIF